MTKKNIKLVRHAQSVANAGGRTANIESIPLTELGQKQSIKLIDTIDFKPDLIVVSPYIRTRLTAQPLIDALGFTNIEVWDEIKELTYLCRKKYANTTEKERHEPAMKFWQSGDPNYRDGEEESFNDLLARGRKMFEKINESKFNNILLFTHKQYLLSVRMSLIYPDYTPEKLMSIFFEEDAKFPIENTSMFTLKDLMK